MLQQSGHLVVLLHELLNRLGELTLLTEQVAVLEPQLLYVDQVPFGLQSVHSVLVIVAGQRFVCELKLPDTVFELVDREEIIAELNTDLVLQRFVTEVREPIHDLAISVFVIVLLKSKTQ